MLKQIHDPAETVSDVVFRQIREDIISGTLPPGAKIKLEQAKERYSIGISSLREILSRLTTENLVVAEGQRGFEVSPLRAANSSNSPTSGSFLKHMRSALPSLREILNGRGVSSPPTTGWLPPNASSLRATSRGQSTGSDTTGSSIRPLSRPAIQRR